MWPATAGRRARAGHGIAEEAIGVGEVVVALGQAEDGSNGGVDGEVAQWLVATRRERFFISSTKLGI
ncbi:hypothetical protein Acr_04g0004820 [Actinidia rufa]|uniref:Uncharacterized protein n=1 Tax=Actinidia rufa TaxID=165716 RepID=A0A7J0EGY4_9ERIC|nr:hypothetical protein Acr_04g0004820 [Actinidia rufa]